MRRGRPILTLALIGAACQAQAGELRRPALQRDLAAITRGFDGPVGACAQDGSGRPPVCVEGDRRFALQSVMKLLVAIAVLDGVDHGRLGLRDPVVVHRRDLGLASEPIARLVTAAGYRTTIGDLARRAIVDSDSAAGDVLLTRIGGPAAVQAVLDRKGITGVRIDRSEHQLQTESDGLTWRPAYANPDVRHKALAKVTRAQRAAAFRASMTDVRDTSTPRGMAELLNALAGGRLLSPASTAWLLNVMGQTKTFPDRLKAGLSPGWTIGHKTGASGASDGVTEATNDVGVLTSPRGERVSVAVFIGPSRAASKDRAALMARIARATIADYSPVALRR